MHGTLTISEQIQSDFAVFTKMQRTFFNPKYMNYTSADYFEFAIEEDFGIVSNNTFYSNRKSFEDNYYNQMYNRYDTKDILQVTLFYKRIKAYLCNVSTWAQENSCPPVELRHLQVTHDFFPYYISLICSDSKKTNWYNLKENILDISQTFFKNYATIYQSAVSPVERDSLIKYWLELTFPNKLYDLTLQISDILTKEINYPTYRTLKLNLGLFLEYVSGTTFRTLTLQDEFINTAAERLSLFLVNRRKGTTIGDELLTVLPLYGELENYIYTHIRQLI